MTAQSAIPLKWYVPFATGDSSRVELPVTSSDPTRASQTLGFPPLTMQPPAVGGVPPQGEDFNGGMNQVARVCWWVLNGGGWPYDATFASNSNINGYPSGAVLQSADFLGQWINTSDNNQINPDTVGTNWVPGFQYGSTSITGQTGGTTTLVPLQAAKRNITVSGTLASAQTLILPAWIKDWTVTNNTTGAFTLIVKTLAGSGVTIPQNGHPTPVSGDGTNINQLPQNIAPATSNTDALQAGQALGLFLGVQVFTASGTYTPGTYTVAGRSITATKALIKLVGGGGGGGGVNTTNSAQAAASNGGNGGEYKEYLITSGLTSQTVTIGGGGAGGAAGFNVGIQGGTTSFGAIVSAVGGLGGQAGGSGAPPYLNNSQANSGGGVPSGNTLVWRGCALGGYGLALSLTSSIGGQGGDSPFGVGGKGSSGPVASGGYGGGGGGAGIGASGAATAGAAGSAGLLIVLEYA